jgi:hypothetical protein
MNASDPPDVTLLLRAHSEQRWLSREVIPVVRQLETGEHLPEEQLPAAVAYLEVIWVEAGGLAREADAALRRLDAGDGAQEGLGSPAGEGPGWRGGVRLGSPGAESPSSPSLSELRLPLSRQLPSRARRYHAAVRALREAVARHVTPLIKRGMLVETGTDKGDTRSAGIPESASAGGACLPASVEGECLPASVAAPASVLPEGDLRDLVS